MSGDFPLGHIVKGTAPSSGDLSCFIAAPYILPAAALFPWTPCRPTLVKQVKNGSYEKCLTVGLPSYYKCKKI